MRAAEYERAAKNLDRFLAAYGRLLANMERADGWGGPSWRLRSPNLESEANSAYNDCARFAGAAADAFDMSGMGIEYKPPGTWQTRDINPALVWSNCFEDSPMVDAPLVALVGAQALGRLEHLHAEQQGRERGFVGAIAWFFTLAPRVRAAAGLPANSASGALVAGTTVAIQGLLVAAVGGALAYPIADWFGWMP